MAGKKQQFGLGRGLGALLGDDVLKPEEPKDEVRRIPILSLDPDGTQPRRSFDEEQLRDLAASIASVGILQPIIVRPVGDRFTIVAGERRFRAARMAGLTEIPCIVRDWEKERRLEATLIENLQRDDLNPIEEAVGIRTLMEATGLTQETAAERLGMSRPALANRLRLLNLPEKVVDMLREGTLSEGHGRALGSVKDPGKQEKLALLCAAQGWSVRQFEKICRASEDTPAEVKPPKPKKDPQIRELEGLVRETLGLKVRLDGDLDSGKLILSYYTRDDLQRLWDMLTLLKEGHS